MSLASLQIGISGIHAARRGMEVVSENIANVNTEAYARRRVEQTVQTRLAPTPSERARELEAGVVVTGVNRMGDTLLDSSFRNSASQAAGAAFRADVAARAEEVLGPLDSGVQSAINGFWASWERLASRPQDLAARQEVLSAGAQAAATLRSASRQVSNLVERVSAHGVDVVNKINTYSTQLAQLNQQIGDAVFRGTAPNDLLDARDALLDKIARLTSITVVHGDNRQANVYVGNYPLVEGASAQQIVQPPTGGPTWGAGGFPVEVSGELGAVQEALSLTLPQVQSALDDIATHLQTVVNDQHALGTDLDGNPGAAFFVGSGAETIGVNPDLAARGIAAGLTAAPADNRNALELSKLGDRPLPSGKTVNGMASELAGQLGGNAASTDQMAKVMASSHAGVQDLRSSLTGVQLDEELSDLIRYQRAFEAAARVLTTADEILDVLINRTGLVGR